MTAFYDRVKQMDDIDPLRRYRERFAGSEKIIYLDGNSLGKLPIATQERIEEVVKKEWGDRLIRSWNEKWMHLSGQIASKIARIAGAQENEIFVGDTTSLNLFKLAYAALKIQAGRDQILTDDLNFPSDQYVMQSLTSQHFPEHSINSIKSNDGISVPFQQLRNATTEKTALITLSHVAYKNSFLYDMAEVNDMAHEFGTITLWDLSHSVGAIPISLNESGADMAVGCSYKYLNGGPGAPAFLYVRKDLQEKLSNPIWSWFGHRSPFDFDPKFKADPGIQKFAVSTPSVLSLSAIEPGLDIILEAGMDNLHAKSILQGALLMQMIQAELIPLGFEIASPLAAHRRGSHISIKHEKAYAINRALIDPLDKETQIIIPDFRPPNLIRIGIAPLYNSFMDLYLTIQRIKEIVEGIEINREFDQLTVS